MCLELANDYPFPIWTFITPVRPGGIGLQTLVGPCSAAPPSAAACSAAACSAAACSAADAIALHPHAAVHCARFEASHGRGLRVVQFASAPAADDPAAGNPAAPGAAALEGHGGRLLPPTAQHDALLAQGWLLLEPQQGHEGYALGVPAVTAVPLAAGRGPGRRHRPPPTVLSPVTLRLDHHLWEASQAAGRIALAVLQATAVCAVAPGASEASEVELAAAAAAAAARGDHSSDDESAGYHPDPALPPPVFQRSAPGAGWAGVIAPADFGLPRDAAPARFTLS